MIVDAHQHFWRLSRGDYGWNTPELSVIHRDFFPAELKPLLDAAGVGRTVLVQAAESVAETDYMLGLADGCGFVAAVVGWINFEDSAERAALERLAGHPKFRGVRPQIQSIPDRDWMLRPDIRWAFDAIVDLGLTFDALGLPVHLDNFARLFDRHPDLRVVIDHCAKPEIRNGAFDGWAADMARLARETGAFCKLSGLATEAAPGWTGADLAPYGRHVLDCFGPARVMWGSDWPVLKLAGDYQAWLDLAKSWVPEAGQQAVFGGTATEFYNLS